jgi:hypothetical protein
MAARLARTSLTISAALLALLLIGCSSKTGQAPAGTGSAGATGGPNASNSASASQAAGQLSEEAQKKENAAAQERAKQEAAFLKAFHDNPDVSKVIAAESPNGGEAHTSINGLSVNSRARAGQPFITAELRTEIYAPAGYRGVIVHMFQRKGDSRILLDSPITAGPLDDDRNLIVDKTYTVPVQ